MLFRFKLKPFIHLHAQNDNLVFKKKNDAFLPYYNIYAFRQCCMYFTKSSFLRTDAHVPDHIIMLQNIETMFELL